MFSVKRILQFSVMTILVAGLVGGALARGGGGHGGGGHGGGGHSGGGGGGMHASAMRGGGGGMGNGGGMSRGGNFSSHSSGMSSMARNGGRGQSFAHSDSGQTAFHSSDMGRHSDGVRQSSFRTADNNGSRFGDGNRDGQVHNARYDQLMSFMNDGGSRGGNHGSDFMGGQDHGDRGNVLGNNFGGDNHGARNGFDNHGDRGNRGGNGNFNSRFANDNGRSDHHGSNFNRDDFRRNADSIRHDFHDRHDVPFRNGWWGNNRRWNNWWGPWASNGWWGNPWYWWGWSTAPYLDSWLGYGWSQPCYWDYGPNGYVTYNYGNSYDGNYGTGLGYQTYLPTPADQPQVPVTGVYKQAYDLAHSAPTLDNEQAAKSDWLPLGVFAVTKPGKQEENWMVQLGVNKQGVLTGTYYNQEKDSAHPLVGMVDKDSHQAAWYFADGTENPMVFETSVDNLTQPQATVKVHFGPGDSGVWQMVRLERPEATENQGQATPQGNEALPTPPQHELP